METVTSHLPASWLALALPIEVDVGCHKGKFLAEMAQRYPDRRFLGIERQSSRVAGCVRKIGRLELTNAHAWCGEGLGIFRELELKARVIHVSFPDPWPKRRHHIRRLVGDGFFDEAWRVLEPKGSLRLMTDDEPYFRAMERAAANCEGFEASDWDDGREYPPTEFQMKFESKPVYRLALRRCDSMSSA